MKKIINAVENVEEEMILGLVKSAPDKLRKLDCGNVVVRVPRKARLLWLAAAAAVMSQLMAVM